MKLKVLHDDGRIETLTLTGQVECLDGRELDRIRTSELEHFFTKDGYYDGWGRETLSTPTDAQRLRTTIETLREIDDAPTA